MDLQNCLNSFNSYCEDWRLKVNANKTKIIVFGARNPDNFRFTLGDNNLEITKQYHYLGLTFTSNGSFLTARKRIIEQSNKAMHLLFTKSSNANLPIDLILKLFDHTVSPILTYASEVFGFENLDNIENVHSIFLRKITKARKSTPMYMIYGELGRYPVSINIKCRMISFWSRLILGKQQKISLGIYKYMLNHPRYEFKWLNKIKDILISVGRNDLWLNQQASINLHKHVKQILIDQFKQKWFSELDHSNKSRFYKSIKDTHGLEMYFKTLRPHQIVTLFRIRTANHNLPIERGRWEGINISDRQCTLCDYNEIGSERHYIFSCPYFSDARNKYLSNINLHEINIIQMLTSKSVYLLADLCNFLNYVFVTFQSLYR